MASFCTQFEPAGMRLQAECESHEYFKETSLEAYRSSDEECLINVERSARSADAPKKEIPSAPFYCDDEIVLGL